MNEFSSVSIVGMCKNAGKTTALNGIIREFSHNDNTLALTSIGRDGESTDVLKGTPKPKIYVYEGTVLATAQDLLPLCDITREILDTTGITTPLGEVVIVRALSDGFVQIAGPSTVDGLVRVSGMMRSFGADRVLIDGAVARKSLSTPQLSQAVILCTGASYSPDMNKTVIDTAFTAHLFNLPKTEFDVPNINAMKAQGAKYYIINTDHEFMPLSLNGELSNALKVHKNSPALFITGAITDAVLSKVLDSGRREIEIISENSGKLLISQNIFDRLSMRQIRLRVLQPSRLAAVTINPFSANGIDFDEKEFHSSIVRAIHTKDMPIINVVSGEVLYAEF